MRINRRLRVRADAERSPTVGIPLGRKGTARTGTRARRLVGYLALAALGTTCGGSADRPPAPNVLLISIDTLRADHLAAYGYHRETSPALTRAAARGVRFTDAYSQAPSTVPTHASMFTGRLPIEHGVFGYQQRLGDEELTLAEHLGDHGYRTFAIASSIRFILDSGFSQGFDDYHLLTGLKKNQRSSAATEHALKQIEEAGDEPFFGFIHYFDPHAPYAPPAPYATRYHPGIPQVKPRQTPRYLKVYDTPERPLPEGVLEYLEALYDASILYLDPQLERLFEGLRELGREDDTVVVITSDHGEEFKEHGGLTHANRLHEEVLRVPLLVIWPDRLAAGAEVERPAQSIDLFSTLCDLLDIPVPEGQTGTSMARYLLRAGDPVTAAQDRRVPRDVILVQHNHRHWGLLATLDRGRFKMISSAISDPTLYHLDTDPMGFEDISEIFPDELVLMEEMGEDIQERARRQKRLSVDRENVSEEELETLRSLGYLGGPSG